MMNFYKIAFFRQYEDDNVQCSFFVYAKTKQEAVKRFCLTTGYNKCTIVSIERI